MHDPISDLLTRIRNAGAAQHATLTMPHSKMKESVAHVLKREGYLTDVSVEGDKLKSLKLGLRYDGKKSVIIGLKQISTPGLRRYVRSTEIPRVLGGMGISVISTSKGIMSGQDAKKNNLGGEIVCYVW
jgi:small subunit ribosomal protein S8